MRIIISVIGLAGVVLFGMAFLVTFYIPGGIESQAQDFIKERIEIETGDKIDSLTDYVKDSELGELAQQMLKGRESEAEQLKSQLQNKAYEKIAGVMAEMRDLSCECRKIISEKIKSGMESRLSLLQSGSEKLVEFLKMKYMQIAMKLTLDFRIFSGCNLFVFLILSVLVFSKPRAMAHLYLPGMLLVISTVICSYFYLFEQNWFYTILYNDYVGFGYLGYVGFLFFLFSDIVFNAARFATEIINAFFSLIGSALSVSPC